MRSISICLFIFIFHLMKMTIGWKAILDRHEIPYINEKRLKVTNAIIAKYNRTTKSASFEVEFLRDLPKSVIAEIKVYGFLSNQYRELPLVISRKICDMLSLEYQWVKHEIQGHFLETCPILKGKYYIKDYVPNVSRFPKKPWSINNYMLQLRVFDQKDVSLIVRVFVITTDDDEYTVK